jgi:hypothetical protein
MKFTRRSAIFAILVLGTFLLAAFPVHAVKLFGVECDPAAAPSASGSCGIENLLKLIKAVIIKILFLLFIAAPIMIAFGGIMIMTAAGSESRVGTGKTIIKAAVIGIAIGLGSYLIIEAIKIALDVRDNFLPGSENVTIPTS